MNSKKECSHRCGACHRAYDARVRIARSKKRKYSDSNVYELEILCTFGQVSRMDINRCFFLPSSRWCCINGHIILKYVTSLRGVNGEISLQRYGGSLRSL